MGYLGLKRFMCECGHIALFVGDTSSGSSALAEALRRDLEKPASEDPDSPITGIAVFTSADGSTVKCPGCGIKIAAPIPETLDVDRHEFGRHLLKNNPDSWEE